MHERLSHAGLTLLLLGLDVLMIVTALFYGILPLGRMPTRCLSSAATESCGTLCAAMSDTAGPAMARVCIRHAPILSMVWLVHPVVLVIGSSRDQVIGAVPLTAAILVLGMVAKGVHGAVPVQGTEGILRERGVGRGERSRCPHGVAARASRW